MTSMRGHGTTWWTWDEVRHYLGHTGPEASTDVWLSRHGIKALRVWDANAIRAEREGHTRRSSPRVGHDEVADPT